VEKKLIMKAVILATGLSALEPELTESRPLGFFNLADRPWIQHIVESVLAQGATSIDFLLYHDPARYEAFLGDGARWGSVFQHHLIYRLETPYSPLRGLRLEGDVLLADESCLYFTVGDLHLTKPMFDDQSWTGWGIIRAEQLTEKLLADRDTMASAVLQGKGAPIWQPPALCFRSAVEILKANEQFLEKRFDTLLCGGREIEPGIWLGRNVVLHPTAKLIAPVFLSADCQIGAASTIGPHAVIGKNCILGANLQFSHSLMLDGGFLGDGLALQGILVDRGRLTDTESGVHLHITDPLLAGKMASRLGRFLRQGGHQLLALLLLVVLSPLIFLSWLAQTVSKGGGNALVSTDFVRQPTVADVQAWTTAFRWRFGGGPRASQREHFQRDFLPGLAAVVAGRLFLVGVEPRTPEQLQDLPKDWRTMLLNVPPGLVTEALVTFGTNPKEDELYISESFYAMRQSLTRDLHMLVIYFATLLLTPPKN
jgi:NDP-sugar pyrophosphorylase family protein/lipopolysaccharide/colanic/teichoic acid biosynthesis glycosyltransferase